MQNSKERANLLGNMLAGKGIVRAGYGNRLVKQFMDQKKILIPPRPLTSFEIQKYW